MEEFAERVEQLISKSNTAVRDHLFAKVSFALNICRLAQHHARHEKTLQLRHASWIYKQVDEFRYRRELIVTEELTSSLKRLQLELQKTWFECETRNSAKNDVVMFHNLCKSRSKSVRSFVR